MAPPSIGATPNEENSQSWLDLLEGQINKNGECSVSNELLEYVGLCVRSHLRLSPLEKPFSMALVGLVHEACQKSGGEGSVRLDDDVSDGYLSSVLDVLQSGPERLSMSRPWPERSCWSAGALTLVCPCFSAELLQRRVDDVVGTLRTVLSRSYAWDIESTVCMAAVRIVRQTGAAVAEDALRWIVSNYLRRKAHLQGPPPVELLDTVRELILAAGSLRVRRDGVGAPRGLGRGELQSVARLINAGLRPPQESESEDEVIRARVSSVLRAIAALAAASARSESNPVPWHFVVRMLNDVLRNATLRITQRVVSADPAILDVWLEAWSKVLHCAASATSAATGASRWEQCLLEPAQLVIGSVPKELHGKLGPEICRALVDGVGHVWSDALEVWADAVEVFTPVCLVRDLLGTAWSRASNRDSRGALRTFVSNHVDPSGPRAARLPLLSELLRSRKDDAFLPELAAWWVRARDPGEAEVTAAGVWQMVEAAQQAGAVCVAGVCDAVEKECRGDLARDLRGIGNASDSWGGSGSEFVRRCWAAVLGGAAGSACEFAKRDPAALVKIVRKPLPVAWEWRPAGRPELGEGEWLCLVRQLGPAFGPRLPVSELLRGKIGDDRWGTELVAEVTRALGALASDPDRENREAAARLVREFGHQELRDCWGRALKHLRRTEGSDGRTKELNRWAESLCQRQGWKVEPPSDAIMTLDSMSTLVHEASLAMTPHVVETAQKPTPRRPREPAEQDKLATNGDGDVEELEPPAKRARAASDPDGGRRCDVDRAIDFLRPLFDGHDPSARARGLLTDVLNCWYG